MQESEEKAKGRRKRGGERMNIICPYCKKEIPMDWKCPICHGRIEYDINEHGERKNPHKRVETAGDKGADK